MSITWYNRANWLVKGSSITVKYGWVTGAIATNFEDVDDDVELTLEFKGVLHHHHYYWLVVWNIFYFFHILGIIIPTDFHIFQRGWNHQWQWDQPECSWRSKILGNSDRSYLTRILSRVRRFLDDFWDQVIYGLSVGFQCLKGAVTVPIEQSWSCCDKNFVRPAPRAMLNGHPCLPFQFPNSPPNRKEITHYIKRYTTYIYIS